jgi:hypothetical protein
MSPATSQKQRAFLYATKGPAWVKRHGFDNPGTLPTYVHPKRGSMASSTQRLASKLAASRSSSGANWMAGAVKHPGALRAQLKVPAGQKIPAKKLASAARSSDPTLARRARLAQTFAKYRP